MTWAHGLVFFPRSPDLVVRTVRLMEELGYDLAGLIDSHALSMDVYVALTLAAANTSRLRIGPCVTNPVTRDLSVTASAIASVDLASGGRAYLGISRGFSGARAVGVTPAATSAMARVIPHLRALLAGRETTMDGRTMRIAWARRAVPIYLAASGPRGLRIGGRVADGVLMHMGLFPEVVQAALEHVRVGAGEAGRDWRDLDLCVYGAAACSPDGRAARDSVRGAVAGMGASVFSPGPEGKQLPPELEAAVARLRREYLVTGHMQAGDEHNVGLMERLGLTDYLVDRFAFAGTPEEVRRKVDGLKALGVTRFVFNVCMSPDIERDARALAQALRLQGAPR